MEIRLKRGKEVSVGRKHPWIFSGALANNQELPENGSIVTVSDHKGNFIARGHFHNSSIAIRILTHDEEPIDMDFFIKRISAAYELRKIAGLVNNPETTVYRLVNAEGDGLPGLIIDWYNGVAVVEVRTDGMIKSLDVITEALKHVIKESLTAVYCKSEVKASFNAQYTFGQASVPHTVHEYGHQFQVDWEEGQKTGFFIDQRENRKILGAYSKDRKVLNAFSYTGGFSVYALKNGAASVHSVDASQDAINLANKNAEINEVSDKHDGVAADVFDYLKSNSQSFDLIIIDPPAFAKSRKKRHNAVIGYKRLNKMALKAVSPGGLVFTFSCSQVMSQKLFEDTVRAAGIESKRDVKVLKRVVQPEDHPVNLYHPEGAYLKGLLLKVD